MYIYTCISHVSSHLYRLDHIYLTTSPLCWLHKALKSGVLPDDLKEPGDQRVSDIFGTTPNFKILLFFSSLLVLVSVIIRILRMMMMMMMIIIITTIITLSVHVYIYIYKDMYQVELNTWSLA